MTVRSIDPADPGVVLSGLTITNGSGTLYLLSTAKAAGQVRQFCGGGTFGTRVEERFCGGGIMIENELRRNRAEEGGAIWVAADSRLTRHDPDDNSYAGNQPDQVYHKAE